MLSRLSWCLVLLTWTAGALVTGPILSTSGETFSKVVGGGLTISVLFATAVVWAKVSGVNYIPYIAGFACGLALMLTVGTYPAARYLTASTEYRDVMVVGTGCRKTKTGCTEYVVLADPAGERLSQVMFDDARRRRVGDRFTIVWDRHEVAAPVPTHFVGSTTPYERLDQPLLPPWLIVPMAALFALLTGLFVWLGVRQQKLGTHAC